jgi:hypothetical protein
MSMITDPTFDPTTDAPGHLRSLVAATNDVMEHLELLDSCRFGPPAVLEAAVADLRLRLAVMEQRSPKGTGVTMAEMVATSGDDGGVAAALADTVRANVARIHERSSTVVLELQRLAADTQDVVSSTAGGAGTYDANGRTPAGGLRRDRAIG